MVRFRSEDPDVNPAQKKPRTRPEATQDSPLMAFLIGTLVLSLCFLSLCAYAAHQRNALLRDGRNLDGTSHRPLETAKAMEP
jgi:hypothetical protein